MSETPTWTILVATLTRRADRLRGLLDVLLPQLDPHAGAVRVLAFANRGEHPLGQVRQALVEVATGDYVSFVDDDDQVPTYYVDEVVAALAARPDYVGWRMQCYVDGEPLKPTLHSLRYAGWWDDNVAYYRDVSHLNPIRRELALKADFRRGDPPEDVAWVNQVRGLPVTEAFIDKVMYYYYSSSTDSTWRGVTRDHSASTTPRLDVDHPYFTYHPGSSV